MSLDPPLIPQVTPYPIALPLPLARCPLLRTSCLLTTCLPACLHCTCYLTRPAPCPFPGCLSHVACLLSAVNCHMTLAACDLSLAPWAMAQCPNPRRHASRLRLPRWLVVAGGWLVVGWWPAGSGLGGDRRQAIDRCLDGMSCSYHGMASPPSRDGSMLTQSCIHTDLPSRCVLGNQLVQN